VTGRPVDIPAIGEHWPRRRRLAAVAAVLVLVALGVAIGSRIAAPGHTVRTETVTVASSGATPTTPAARAAQPTRVSAVAAAATDVSELDGMTLLDPSRLRHVLDGIASTQARPGLVAAYQQAATQARDRLGLGTVPAPVVILRAAPVGYRFESYGSGSATVSIWRVGIVGSGATVDPQQSWATETVRLVWQRGTWKVAAFSSTPGPTPPLPTTVAPTSRADLFHAVPTFQEFASAGP
jgi:hypothetical protein